jgi:hypothetical protein
MRDLLRNGAQVALKDGVRTIVEPLSIRGTAAIHLQG